MQHFNGVVRISEMWLIAFPVDCSSRGPSNLSRRSIPGRRET